MRNYFLEKYEVEFAKHAEILNSYNEKVDEENARMVEVFDKLIKEASKDELIEVMTSEREDEVVSKELKFAISLFLIHSKIN